MIRRLVVLSSLSLGLFAAEPVVSPTVVPPPAPASGAPVSAAPVSAAPVPAAPGQTALPMPAGAPGEAPVRGPQGGRVWLGVILEEGASFDGKPQPKVTRVIPGSTAEKLGLQPGDQLTQLGDTPITSVDTFRTASATLKVGEMLTAKILRGTQHLDLKATIEAPPRPRDVLTDTDKVKSEIADLRSANERAATTSRLEELLTLLNTVQKGLPESAAEFKKVYPKGTFNIQIKIDIQSDPAVPNPTPLPPAVVPPKITATALVAEPVKPDDKKSEDKKSAVTQPADKKVETPAAGK